MSTEVPPSYLSYLSSFDADGETLSWWIVESFRLSSGVSTLVLWRPSCASVPQASEIGREYSGGHCDHGIRGIQWPFCLHHSHLRTSDANTWSVCIPLCPETAQLLRPAAVTLIKLFPRGDLVICFAPSSGAQRQPNILDQRRR
jgi:hypothetical protein